jgi:hypothetical protein
MSMLGSNVRVGNTQRMQGGTTPPPPPPPPPVPLYERKGPFAGGIPNASWTGGGWAQALENAARFQQGGGYVPGLPSYTNIAPVPAQQIGGSAYGDSAAAARPSTTGTVGTPPPGMSFQEYIASLGLGGGGGGGGASRPDFSAYRAALTDQASGINAQIQAMYNALASEAGANVGRIQDIYGGASEGIGTVYDSATGNIQDAYASSQQQAADQMARLGIEAAAPAVIDPMALSQAEAVAGLEGGRASGLAATERYGSSAAGFGSQMAQVAQQQGTEMNAAVLASLQNRLADSLLAEQSAGGGGGGGGGRSLGVSDMLKLQDAYRRDVMGELPLEDRKFAFDVAQAAARPVNQYSEWARDKFFELTSPQDGRRPLMTPEEAQAYLNAVDSTLNR